MKIKLSYNLILFTVILISTNFYAQIDSTLFKRAPQDTLKQVLNMDAIYNRPFLTLGKTPVSVGGYLEANWQYANTDGITDGHQFQARRMTLFFSSTINRRLKFLSEIEFEEGGRKIAIEFASLDLEIHPLLNFRGGIIMNPIGAFNQNHDGPKWEFIDRPISATQMLPATWSNSGFGLFGKKYAKKWMFGYEIYLSGNFDNSIIENAENKTFLASSKNNPDRFEEINSGLPLLTGKIAIRNVKFGELGLSYMGGVYNKFEQDGFQLDKKRRVDILALDYNVSIPKTNTKIIAEWAWINVDVPETYFQLFGEKQFGGFIDIVQPIISKPMLSWKKAVLNLACRLEYVDWNDGDFKETNTNISEHIFRFSPGISFRPSSETVFRFNYVYQKQTDFLGNSPAFTAILQAGFSTYF